MGPVSTGVSRGPCTRVPHPSTDRILRDHPRRDPAGSHRRRECLVPSRHAPGHGAAALAAHAAAEEGPGRDEDQAGQHGPRHTGDDELRTVRHAARDGPREQQGRPGDCPGPARHRPLADRHHRGGRDPGDGCRRAPCRPAPRRRLHRRTRRAGRRFTHGTAAEHDAPMHDDPARGTSSHGDVTGGSAPTVDGVDRTEPGNGTDPRGRGEHGNPTI